MFKKIGFVHTGVAIADMFKPMIAERLPGISTFHIVDDSLIQETLEMDGLTPLILKRLCNQICLAEEAGAELIMFTCSSVAPGIDVARRIVNVPVMKIDEPMAEKAVSMAVDIGVLATAKTTMTPSIGLIKEKAEEAGKKVNIHQTLMAEAFICFLRGDMPTHDRLVKDAAGDLRGKAEVIVLAQASMGHLAEEIGEITGLPVLKSPPLAMDALVQRVKG